MKKSTKISVLVELTEAHRLITRAGDPDCHVAATMVMNACMAVGLARQYVLEERQQAWKDARMNDHSLAAEVFANFGPLRRELSNMIYNVRFARKRAEDAQIILGHLNTIKEVIAL